MKYKNILVGLLLFDVFAILKLFLGGESFRYFFTEELIPLLIIFGIISFIMMIIPFLYRIINRKKLEHKKGIIICFINSLGLPILASIPNIITILNNNNYQDTGYSYDPVILAKGLIILYLIFGEIYYFINYLLFVEEKKV